MVLNGMLWMWLIAAVLYGLLRITQVVIKRFTTPQFVENFANGAGAICTHHDFITWIGSERNPTRWRRYPSRNVELVVVPHTIITMNPDRLEEYEDHPITYHCYHFSNLFYNAEALFSSNKETELYVPSANEHDFKFADQQEMLAWKENNIGEQKAWELLESRLPNDQWSRFTRWYWIKADKVSQMLQRTSLTIAIVCFVLWGIGSWIKHEDTTLANRQLTTTIVTDTGELQVRKDSLVNYTDQDVCDSDREVVVGTITRIQELGGGLQSVIVYDESDNGYAILAASALGLHEGGIVYYRNANVPRFRSRDIQDWAISEQQAKILLDNGFKLFKHPNPPKK